MSCEVQEMVYALRDGFCPWHRSVILTSLRPFGTTLDSLRCHACTQEYRMDLEKVKISKRSISPTLKSGLSGELVTVFVPSPCLQAANEVKLLFDDAEDYMIDTIEMDQERQDLSIKTTPFDDCDQVSRTSISQQQQFSAATMTDDNQEESLEDVNISTYHDGTIDRKELDSLSFGIKTDKEQEIVAHTDHKLTIEPPHEEDSWVLFLTEDDVHNEYKFRRNASYMDARIFRLLITYEFLKHRVLNCYPYISPLRRSTLSHCIGNQAEYTNKYPIIMLLSMVSDGSCGKSSLLERYMYGRFTTKETSSTTMSQWKDAETHSRTFHNFPHLDVRLDIQDIHGDTCTSNSSYKRSHCVVIVFSVDEDLTTHWLQEIVRNKTRSKQAQDVMICLNKVDLPLDKWLFTRETFYKLIHPYGFCVLETSASDNLNVEELFFACACMIYENEDHKKHRDPTKPLIPSQLRLMMEGSS
jgi:GTPase SAR1 family protein